MAEDIYFLDDKVSSAAAPMLCSQLYHTRSIVDDSGRRIDGVILGIVVCFEGPDCAPAIQIVGHILRAAALTIGNVEGGLREDALCEIDIALQ